MPRVFVHRLLGLLLLACFPITLSNVAAAPNATITVNPEVTHQTMKGWEAVANAFYDPAVFPIPLTPATMDQIYHRAVNEIGINRIRLEVRSGAETDQDYYAQYKNGTLPYAQWRCRRYATVNDNSDPNNLNLSRFFFTEMDDLIDNIAIPMRQKMQARGEQLYVNLNYVSFVAQITEPGCPAGLQYNHDDSPQEYAEFMLALFNHMQSKYGFVPNAIEVILEPDNTPFWRGKQIGDAIVASAQKLAAAGFTPKFIAPSNTDMGGTLSYFDALAAQVPQALQYMSEISYHRYSGVSDSTLQSIASRGVQYNLGTAMLEWWSDASGYQTLHKDVKMGKNSAWQQDVIAAGSGLSRALINVDNSNPNNPIITVAPMTRYTRHYYEFVRRGAVRVDAQSSSGSYDPLAFRNADGKHVVVVIANSSGEFAVNGLPAGTYGVKYTSLTNSSQFNISAPDVTIGTGQTLLTTLPFSALVTVYAKNAGATVSCDVNTDGSVNVVDVQLVVNQALALAPCTADLDGSGGCDIVDVQRVIQTALGAACRIGP